MATVEMGREHRARSVSAKEFRGDREGLKIDAQFCPAEVADPFDTVQWELRSAAIKDESGKALFEQTDCEIPASWSQLATNVVVSKYFYGDPNNEGEREKSVRQLIHRVTRTIADWGIADRYFDTPQDGENFYRDLTYLCLHQCGAFNSPVWFNVGLAQQYGVEGTKCNWHYNVESGQVEQPENPYEYPQGSACFIQSVGDNMEDIMRLATSEAMLFKFGSGTGTDLSTIRSSRESLTGGGKPSGPLSFMRVYDQIAAVVKSGGKTRRAAKMQSLKVWHPDIMEFIECKWKEEQKAHALIREGYESNFNGEAYSSVMFQNANLSVRVTDEFMNAVSRKQPWKTRWVSGKSNDDAPTYEAAAILERMADCAWHCGDPGVQYDTTINAWHTCPNSGRINASNPCVTGDTLVATTEGYRRIVDMVGKTAEIINGKGEASYVDRIFKTGTKPIYKLTTHSGYSLRLTGDHKVWTENRGDVQACELTCDDAVRLEKPGFGLDFVPAGFGELVGAALGTALGTAVGTAVGDGCATQSHDQEMLFVSLADGERNVAAALQDNITASKVWLGIEDGHSLRSTGITDTATGVRLGSSVSALIGKVRSLAILDAGSVGKKLTDEVYCLDRPSQAAILRGLFTIDGTVANYGGKSQYVALDSTSVELLQQVQMLLLAFGIKAKLFCSRRLIGQSTAMLPDGKGGVREYPVEQMHSLRISGSSRFVFESEIGFMPESDKADKLRLLNENVTPYKDQFVDHVASLEACGVEDVYDLTEPITSHFVAGGIVIHNCSEYMFLDNTACNLSSINLMKFRKSDGTFDVKGFTAASRLFFIAQEILIDHASYPTDRIAHNSHLFRPLGLGYSNLGSLVMMSGLPYDSDAARGLCGSITALLHGSANLASAEIAAVVGPFAEYSLNKEPMLQVMQKHRNAVEHIDDAGPDELKDASRQLWDRVLESGKKHGFRNAQATVLAPTGTISFLMDCDTTGIEPDIALVKYKQLAGGGMLKIVNQSVKQGLRNLGYDAAQTDAIIKFVNENDTIEGAPGFADEHLPVFDCAFTPAKGTRSIGWRAHVQMMSAAQPFLSGAISKTVNMPNDVTVKDIADAYFWGWELGLKAIAIYRDGSKQSQPLSTKSETQKEKDKADKAIEKIVYQPRRERLHDTRNSVTHKFSIAGHEGYLNVGLYADGRPGELFITMAKEGSTIGGLMDSFGTAISLALQYGVPLEVLVNKFSHTRFEPMGYTTNPNIRIAKSVIDYIFRWMGQTFLGNEHEQNGALELNAEASKSNALSDAKVDGNGAAVIPAMPKSDPSVFTQAKFVGLNGSVTADFNQTAATASASYPTGERNGQFAKFQSDAPSCDNCGAITVRNGNCYLCHNCGNSLGCS